MFFVSFGGLFVYQKNTKQKYENIACYYHENIILFIYEIVKKTEKTPENRKIACIFSGKVV